MTPPAPPRPADPAAAARRTPDLPGLPPGAFQKSDSAPDPIFYAQERLVTHIDAPAIAAVTGLYRRLLPPGGRLLDLMSSWVSHLPDDVAYAHVTGHGMNTAELSANPRLDERFVQDLNADPILPLPDTTFDAACLCVSVQYLQRPIEVFQEVARVLRPGSLLIVTFSNRCFPTKAVAIWRSLDGPRQQQLVRLYMQRAGFVSIETSDVVPLHGDPVWAVVGRTPAATP